MLKNSGRWWFAGEPGLKKCRFMTCGVELHACRRDPSLGADASKRPPLARFLDRRPRAIAYSSTAHCPSIRSGCMVRKARIRLRPEAGQALIQVDACGLNNTDVNTRTAWYSAGIPEDTTGESPDEAGNADAGWGGRAIAFPRIQGADVCGRVVGLGAGCDASLLGKRVLVDPWLRDWSAPLDRGKCGYFGSECDGGFADYTVADGENVHVVNSDFSDAELATFATSYVTAEYMLNRADVGSSDRVLISSASGGVGSALVQLARAAVPRPSRSAVRTRPRRSRPLAPIMCCREGPKT